MNLDRAKDRIESQGRISLSQIWLEVGEHQTLSKLGMAIHFAGQSWRSVVASPLTSVVTILTISVSLFLLAGFILVVENLSGALASTQTDLKMSLYVLEGTSAEQLTALQKSAVSMPEIAAARIVSKAQALADFKRTLGEDSAVLEGLDGVNPLPASIELKIVAGRGENERFTNVAELFSKHGAVEHIQYSKGLVKRLASLLNVFQVGGTVAIVFILLITGFIIANTIRLALYAHRDELAIMRLVGATDVFTRAPYLLEGFVQGLVGSILSLALLLSCYSVVGGLITDSPVLRSFLPELHFLSSLAIGLVLALGVGVGVFGSYFALRSYGKG